MSAEYTPTTAEVRAVVTAHATNTQEAALGAAFDRWLEAHDAEVAARALRDAADRIENGGDAQNKWTVRNWLRDRADQIEDPS